MSEAKEIRRAAINLLARREHSQHELREKLARRFSLDLIAEQISLLVEENLQSDSRFVESFVRSRLAKFQGPSRIRNELKLKGVDEHLFEQLLVEQPVDWLALLDELSHRKYGDQPIENMAEKAKRIRFFQYRGFGFDLINEVLD